MSEYAGKAHRGLLVTLVFAMQAAGLIVGPLLAAAMLSTHISQDIIWRMLVAFGAIPALAVFWLPAVTSRSRRASSRRWAREEDESGKSDKKAGHYDPRTHSVSFWDGLPSPGRQQTRARPSPRRQWSLVPDGLRLLRQHGIEPSGPLRFGKRSLDLLQKTLTQLGIFAAFAAPGYAVAALTMDKLGRKTIQNLGFGMMAVTFGAARSDSQRRETGLALFCSSTGSATSSPSSGPMPPPSCIPPRSSL